MQQACERCRGSLVVITLTVGEGTRTLQSCSRCDRREWVADGAPADLPRVLTDLSLAVGRRPGTAIPRRVVPRA